MDILTPTLRGPLHNSLADWLTWGTCTLDPTHSITPPTSLHNPLLECGVQLKEEHSGVVPYGQIILSIYGRPFAYTYVLFRLQLEDPPGPPTNYYCVLFYHGLNTLFARCVSGVSTLIGTWAFTTAIDAWNTFRITWRRGCTPDALRALQANLFWWDDPAWIDLGPLYDTANLWLTSQHNQVALMLLGTPHWTDDFSLSSVVPAPMPLF